jgi:DNA-binding CsgD family transcriptional regulator
MEETVDVWQIESEPMLQELLATLTPREAQVLYHVCHGWSHAEIARHFWVKKGTVDEYMGTVLRKLNVANADGFTNRTRIQLFTRLAPQIMTELVRLEYIPPEQQTLSPPPLLEETDEPVLISAETADFTLAEPAQDESELSPETHQLVQAILDAVQDDTYRRRLTAPPLDNPRDLPVRIVPGSAHMDVIEGTYRRPDRFPALLLLLLPVVGLLLGWVIWGRDDPGLAQIPLETSAYPEPGPPTDPRLTQSPSTVSTSPDPAAPDSVPPTASTTPESAIAGCDTGQQAPPEEFRLLPAEGVSAFTVANTSGAVSSNKARSLTINEQGLWIGYFPDGTRNGGLALYDRQRWYPCPLPGLTGEVAINALASGPNGVLWVGTEHDGLFMLRNGQWRHFTEADGLPSKDIYGLTVDAAGDLWVATWLGVAKYDGSRWTVPYTTANDTIYSDHAHAVAFTSEGEVWVGQITAGVSHLRAGEWLHYTAATGEISSDQVRALLVRPESPTGESVWIATLGGGVTRYFAGKWTTFGLADGLPSLDAEGLAVDGWGRVWVTTRGGVAFYDGQRWKPYHTLPSLAVAIGPLCQGCPFDNDHVWTGTANMGLTHSRLPLTDAGVTVQSICFEEPGTRRQLCPPLERSADGSVITTTYPLTVTAGSEVLPFVTVQPLPGYQLKQERGDMLLNRAPDEAGRLGAHLNIGVVGTVEPGQPYTFVDRDYPLRIPEGVDTANPPISVWQVWYYTRLVGPEIRIRLPVTRSTP